MRHILLTWNPGPDDDEQWSPEQWDVSMVGGTADHERRNARWSVGNRVHGIGRGDRAYMLRQGVHGRGVVATGEIVGEPYPDNSWREDGRSTQYVAVKWEEAVPVDERLDISELQAEIPEFNWRSVYSSGRDITPYGARLERLWSARIANVGVLPAIIQGAGFGTADENRKVERAAVDYVTRAYQADGWQVTSVEGARCGWDLTVTGDEEMHVEVKGVSGSAVRFFLTANEFRAATADSRWLLVVVTDALGESRWYEIDGPTAVAYAMPALFQVRLSSDLFAG